MSTTSKVLTTYPTESEIAAFKKEHGHDNVVDLSVEHKGKNFVLVVKKPEIREIEMAQASMRDSKKSYDYDRSLINNCKLAITEEGLNVTSVFLGWATAINSLIEPAKVTVKNL